MRKSKREENAIIIHFVLYFVLTVGLIAYLTLNIYPKILEIEDDKVLTKNTYNNIERIKNEGLKFNEFIELSSLFEKDITTSEILKNISESFYNENFVNNTEKNYNDFLEAKINEINNPENLKILDEQNKQISNILPSYSVPLIDIGGDELTDYKFINYIESLLETFNLSTESSIGINRINIVEGYSKTNNDGDSENVDGELSNINRDSLESNIFYIPLSLDLSGDKEGIIKFLYFIENVGKIEIKDKQIVLDEDRDRFLYKNGRKIIIEGENYSTNYNILEHQITDIDKLSIDNYIDSSYIDRGDKPFKDFILENQGSENLKISVDLMFYVKGQPLYKIEEFINNILQRYTDTLGLLGTALKDTTIDKTLSGKLKNQLMSLNQMNIEISSIRDGIAKKEKIEEIYKRAVTLNKIVEPIFNSLNK